MMMMDESGGGARGYAKLSNKARKCNENTRSNGGCSRTTPMTGNSRRSSNNGPFSNLSPPLDTYNAIYIAFILGGVGFLLPYNSFIMAMDFFKERYPDSPVVFDMSIVYIHVALLTVLVNNLLVETFSLTTRINFGYIVSFITLIFVVVCEVYWEIFGTVTSYAVNLLAVAIVSIGCTVQQSSYYGYTSMLPPKYTQAVMIGESSSGVFTSTVRVVTRFLVPELRGSTTYFFTVSITSLITCFAMYHMIRRTDFIEFYVALCDRAKTRITLEPTEDAGLIETNDGHYGVLKIQSSPPPSATSGTLSFANPAYEPSASMPTYKVEDVVIRGRQSVSHSGVGLSSIKRGIQARWEVTKCIYPYMISICLVYFTTLCLYPGITSEVISCNLGPWMPIYMMALFNASDLLGKALPSSMRYWTGQRLVHASVFRLLTIPLMIMCVAPRESPIFSSEITSFTLAIVLGLSNGVLGSVPMIQAPTKVEDRHREITGNMMTLMYMFGLAIGSTVAYSLESVLNPVGVNPCSIYVNPKPSNIDVNSTSTVAATVSTTIPSSILISTSTQSTILTTLLSTSLSTIATATSSNFTR